MTREEKRGERGQRYKQAIIGVNLGGILLRRQEAKKEGILGTINRLFYYSMK